MADLTADATTASRRIHEALRHPVVDGDGHWLEQVPVFMDFLRDAGGATTVDAFQERRRRSLERYHLTPEERLARRLQRGGWWGTPSDALTRATVSLPSLLYQRLDAIGIDFAIVYPSLGLHAPSIQEGDLRTAFCHAYNTMAAEMFRPYADRMTPVAIIPTVTPDEAIEELDYAIGALGLKAAMINGTITRPIGQPPPTGAAPTFVDNLVLDSPLDYDPLWQRFVDRGVAVTTHAGSMGWMDRRSPTSHMFNHVGHFAQANHTFARAIFFSGVTNRFPTLNFAFLEGGVAWARSLLCDLIGHWKVRSREKIIQNLRPTNLDTNLLRALYSEYGGTWLSGRIDEQLRNLYIHYSDMSPLEIARLDGGDDGENFPDDFENAGVGSPEEVAGRFCTTSYFGCEADDPMTRLAFDRSMGPGLHAMLGSDIGHFDVPDLTRVLEEAHELVEDGLLSEDDFEAFTYGNAVKLHAAMNPSFFAGTAVEHRVRRKIEAISSESGVEQGGGS